MKERVILMDTREEGIEIGAEEEREKTSNSLLSYGFRMINHNLKKRQKGY